MKDEIWKDIKDYEGLYQVSNLGRVKSLDRKDKLGRDKPSVMKKIIDNVKGYLIVNLKVNGKQKNKLVHRLVAEAFIQKIENKTFVNHKDGNKRNNCVENLEWCNRSENMKHAYKHALSQSKKGENAPKAKLTKKDVEFIRKNCKRYDKELGFEALGKKYNTSATTIKRAVWGDTYDNIL